jgi:hypothetical protein
LFDSVVRQLDTETRLVNIDVASISGEVQQSASHRVLA